MPSGSIEVESKFTAGPGTEARLAALGAALAGSSSFRDLYYDTPDLRLTRADHWLRLRQGAGWELKCPPLPRGGASHGLGAACPEPPAEGAGGSSHVPDAASQEPPAVATTYQELTSPRAVVGRLCGVLGVAPAPGWDQVPGAVAGLGLQEFASFVTRRRSYRLGGLRVDLDQADFGYAVAEVEALVGAQEEVPAAREEVLQLRRALGPDGATRVPGKMSVYLRRHRPRHYQLLLQAGVLAGDPQPPPHDDNAAGPETLAKRGPSKAMELAGGPDGEMGPPSAGGDWARPGPLRSTAPPSAGERVGPARPPPQHSAP
ncbi:putative aminopeptidase NPEPL1 [Platysternon megacephalum]|uniref:Thiamine-triphosphatase n=1 Tax=Platysternon megacephalum TaxID=55544 RepID=A0A4D9DIQ3_9SAUR|nr:putative aminopeptidase NPEPL1 [Platysternon megacephalum]